MERLSCLTIRVGHGGYSGCPFGEREGGTVSSSSVITQRRC
jgi:hypothetical protein